jgi:hypothetical protein
VALNHTCIRFSINDFACSLFNTDKPPTTGTIAIFQLFAAEFSGRFSFLLTTYTPSLPFPSFPFLQTLQVVRKPLLMGPQMLNLFVFLFNHSILVTIFWFE